MKIDDDERERDDAEGQVDVEEPPPGEVVGDPTTDQRSRDGGDPEDGSYVAYVLAALAGAYDVADDGLRERHDGAHPEALHGAGGDQPPEALRRPCQNGAQHEDDDPRDVETTPTVDVGEFADDRNGHGGGEECRGGDPGVMLYTTQLRDDDRHGGRDDSLADRCHQHAEHQPDEDHVLVAGFVFCHLLPLSPSSTGRRRRVPAGIPPAPLVQTPAGDASRTPHDAPGGSRSGAFPPGRCAISPPGCPPHLASYATTPPPRASAQGA